MESTWAQLLVGLLAVVSLVASAALGGLMLACTPLRSPPGAVAQRRPRR